MELHPNRPRSAVERAGRLPPLLDVVPGRCRSSALSCTPLVVNIADAGSWRNIMTVVAADHCWQLDDDSAKDADIYVVMKEEELVRRVGALRIGQRVARIPFMRELCKKDCFAKLMRRVKVTDPERFQFVPQTYCLPDESVPLKAWKGPLIFKPSDGSCGDGISVMIKPWELEKKIKSLKSGCSAVVQAYISNPLLMQSFKWDLRVYVFVLSLEPLRVFLCKEGLARVCCEPYEEPTARTSQKTDCHLTNYSISKLTPNYDHVDDPADGSRGTKRTLSTTLEFLRSLGHEVDDWRAQVNNIVHATTEALASVFDDCEELTVTSNCFQILGFDILVDDSGRAWLLEVNCSPSFSIDAVFPATGPYAVEPTEIPHDSPCAPLVSVAKSAMGSKATRLCKCPSHYRPHRHAPCAVDLTAKAACVSGAFEIVRRDLCSSSPSATCNGPSCAELAAGTDMEVVYDGTRPIACKGRSRQ